MSIGSEKIFTLLSAGPMTAGELVIETGYSLSFVHVLLADMKQEGIIRTHAHRPSRSVRFKGWGRPQSVYAVITEES